jgi:hypothetical protein
MQHHSYPCWEKCHAPTNDQALFLSLKVVACHYYVYTGMQLRHQHTHMKVMPHHFYAERQLHCQLQLPYIRDDRVSFLSLNSATPLSACYVRVDRVPSLPLKQYHTAIMLEDNNIFSTLALVVGQCDTVISCIMLETTECCSFTFSPMASLV